MYDSGLIEAGANPGADLYAAITPVLTGAGFTFLESVVVSGRTHAMWEAPDTNEFGETWIFGFAYYPTGLNSGVVWFHVYEDYNTSTNQVTNGAMYPYLGTFASNGSTTGGTPTDIEDTLLISPLYQLYRDDPTGVLAYGTRISDQGFAWWMSATPDRIIFMTSLDARKFTYAGLYDPHPIFAAAAGANLHPLVCGKVTPYGGNDEDYMFITRYLNGKTNGEFYAINTLDSVWQEVGIPHSRDEYWKPQGGARIYEIVLGNFHWGNLGFLYGIRTAQARVDFNTGEQDYGVGRGDIVNTTDDMDPDTTTANAQWIASAPSIFNGELGVALLMEAI